MFAAPGMAQPRCLHRAAQRGMSGPRLSKRRCAMNALFWLIDTVIHLYIWVLIISAILSWLIAFNVINTHNRFVYALSDVCYRLTEPVLRPIRRVVPLLGGIDLSPVILIIGLLFLQRLIIVDIGYRLGYYF
jgi:YggT family protein